MKIKSSHTLIILSCLVLFGACKKPPEAPKGTGSEATTVYILGTDNNHNFVYWKNGVAAKTPATFAAGGGFVSGDNIYAAGGSDFYVGPGTTGTAGYWNNGAVTTLPAATGYAFASAIFASGGDVYLAGTTYYPDELTTPYTTPTATYPTAGNVATYWKNGVAATLPSAGIDGQDAGFTMSTHADYVSGIFVSGNDVYVSGGSHLSQIGVDSTYHFARYWKNGISTDLINGLVNMTSTHESYPTSTAIYVAGNDLYVAGFESNGGDTALTLRALYWKNGIAKYLTTFAESTAVATAIFVSGSDVYVAGYEAINGTTYATYWKNGVATNLAIATDNTYTEASSIFVSGKDVYLAGIEIMNGTQYAVYWKNGKMVNLGENETATSIYVQ